MHLGAPVYAVNGRQADEADRFGFAVDKNGAADIGPTAAQVILEPRLVDVFRDVPGGSAEPVDKIAILPPAIDDRNILASELTQRHHAITSATAAATRSISASPYR